MHQRGHGPGLRRRVDDPHPAPRSNFATCAVDASSPSPAAPSYSPITPSTDREIASARPVREQGRDQLRAAQIRVEIPPHAPGGERVVPGVDVVGPHPLCGDTASP